MKYSFYEVICKQGAKYWEKRKMYITICDVYKKLPIELNKLYLN